MKKTIKLLSAMTLVMLLTLSCSNGKNEKNEETTETTTEAAWVATYSGILPCADCDGITTYLSIKEGNTYSLTTSYIGVEDPQTSTLEGTYEWVEEGSIIKLNDIEEGTRSPYFKIEEDKALALDMERNVVESELAEHYILKKVQNPALEDKTWQLIEFKGEAIEESTPEMYFIHFDSSRGFAYTKVACNNMNFSYKVVSEQELELTRGVTTLMACPEGSIEDTYREALNSATRYSLDCKTLILTDGSETPLAKYTLVEE